MIEVIRDEQGDITAVCEWLLFNERAEFVDDGKVLFVAEVEVNKAHRGNGTIRRFIKLIYPKCPWIEKVFFFREYKYPGKRQRVYNIDRILRRGG
jgi:hypothetical protein